MPDRNGLSQWAERDDPSFHLLTTLQAFERSFFYSDNTNSNSSKQETEFAHTNAWMKRDLSKWNVDSVEKLAAECRKVLKSKSLVGISSSNNNNKSKQQQQQQHQQQQDDNDNNNNNNNSNNHYKSLWNDVEVLKSLCAFLPSPVGFKCYQLAEEAVQRVETGMALASYIHRGSKKGEKWNITTTTKTPTKMIMTTIQENNQDDKDCCWTLDVDCAGFIRNVLKSVTGSDFVLCLSDRDYMRAKDFYTCFERLEYTVKDVNRVNPAEEEDDDDEETDPLTQLKWCRVDDLRSVLAGDIIVYRAKGGAAGGSVFTKKDCLRKALEDVKTAELYDLIDVETGDQPVDINVSKLPEVKEWVEDVMQILATVGIEEIDMLRGDNEGGNDEDNDDNLQVAISILEKEEKLSENTVSLLQEVLSSTNGNTGHIMFASGPAEETKSHIWRVPVFHSTGVGPKSKRGIQRAYKRFEWSPKYERWTRGGPQDDVEGNHIEVVVGRMCV